ncbi:MAG: hypothetical protein KBS65_06875 [Prevotella sp.]|nr:hypothetical protein [Candidatus Equicola stercoris]
MLFIFAVIIIAVSVILLSVKILITKDGEFPDSHIESSQAMKERDIHCVLHEDRLQRQKTLR